MVRILIGPAALAAVLLAAGPVAADPSDVARGRTVFASQCSTCHSDAKGGGVILGPPLYGVIGRKAGSVNGFAYSNTMKMAGFVWTAEQLRNYLPAPRTYLPGVKMTYPGLKDPSKLDALITYLGSLK